MALRKLYSIRWRVFVPLTLLLWLTIGVLMVYRINFEGSLRRENLELRLRNVNETLLQTYRDGGDMQQLLDFVEYFYQNSVLSDIRATAYSSDGQVLASTSIPMLLENSKHQMAPEVREVMENDDVSEVTSVRETYLDRTPMIFNVMTSNDGKVQVLTAVPNNAGIARVLSYDSVIWIIVAALGMVSTLLIYLVSRSIGRNVTSLRDFAVKAANGEISDVDNFQFSHDELGEVSHQIVSIYMERNKAMEQSRMEHEMAMRAVSERERIKREMSNNINHELKTPVGVIKGYLDTINSDPDMPESLRTSFLKKAQEHAERLTQLLKDVSSITRLDEGTQQVELTNFDFHDLVYTLANDIEVSHIAKDMKFEYNIPFDCMVRGNYTLLNNAMLNLVRNAASYSKGTVITLNLVKSTDTHYVFSFRDDGQGVGEEYIDRLFERFYRVDDGRARKSGGTGLGLPIVKSTFQAIGGDIEVRNAKPHGLEFIFTIPKATPKP